MKKLKQWVEKWMDGKEVRDIKNVPLETRLEILRIYKFIISGGKPEFIDGKIKEILDKCGIEIAVKGVGWRVI